jgi:hypothetical protein
MDAKLANVRTAVPRTGTFGDADTGYVLTEGDGKICLVREVGTGKAMTAPCDSDEIAYSQPSFGGRY